MATLKMQGLEEYERMLSNLSSFETISAVCGVTIYTGAEIIADAIKSGIESLPIVDHRKLGSEGDKLRGITSLQKKGLIESFGISPMAHKDGYYNVKLGFDGYNDVKTNDFPGGQPNSMIARSVNSGTSFREKIPFVDRAVKGSKKKAEEAMVKKAESEFKKLTKG